jgi:hypothetical protein
MPQTDDGEIGDAGSASQTAFFHAVEHGDVVTVQRLVSGGVDVDALDPRMPPAFRATALITATCREDGAMVRLLLTHGTDVDARDESGATALFWACNMEATNALNCFSRRAPMSAFETVAATRRMVGFRARM